MLKIAKTADHLEQLRKYARPRPQLVKAGELGGAGNDIPFEQAFSNLAHSYLRDKAPSLLDYEQGFQLLDRNQENTKAVGVFGFKVGSTQLFAPVFFLKGDLKGHELLYIKNQDLFVPMKENWLNYILNRKPNTLGQGVGRNSSDLGISGPALGRMNSSPYKFSSAMPPLFRDVMPALAAAATLDVRKEREKFASNVDLKEFIKHAGVPMLSSLVKTMQAYPKFAAAVSNRLGGMEPLQRAVAAAQKRASVRSSVLDAPARKPVVKTAGSVLDEVKPPHPIKTGAIKVLTYDTTQVTDKPVDISDEDREKLLNDGMLILDAREDADVSIPYNVQVERKLFNPTESGLYLVLTKPGTFKECFVAYNPVGPSGRVQFATLVRTDGEPDWLNIHPSRIFCASKIEGEEYDNWFESLSEPKSLDTSESRYVLVGPRGNATLPFKVEKSLGDAEGDTTYEVDYSDYCNYEYADSLLAPNNPHRYPSWTGSSHDAYSKSRDGQRLHLHAKRGTQLRSQLGDVWVPEGYKLLTVKRTKADADEAKRKDGDMNGCFACCDEGQSEDEPLQPGNLLDAELAIRSKTAELVIRDRSSEFLIGDRLFNPQKAVIHLVVDHGFRQKTAEHLLAQAVASRKFSCRVKYAGPYLTEGAPGAPSFPDPQMGGGEQVGYGGQSQQMQEDAVQVPSMSAANTDRSVYNPQTPDGPFPNRDMATIQKAMQTGQKDVFDTSVIGSMLKAVRDDTMVDRYLPKLISGMDSLARILFMFYWHGDRFADRYGKGDMPELEDSLRNALEMSGDVILFLKQKTVEPYPEEDSVSLDLGATADA